ncbi:hypothetical protein [Nostoc sp. 'Peltigera membranacea cyanobiont' 213]|uniref:hypothetical protein n=1 Tax=Nostoc sp. 'Peltigera membranacea cyanobiont' 213 TaxID=2014530 RepID=UPI00167D756A|nr:hypothetical protein [Nostoc sp. 'Peltigera membranacea cyanobiont' 213]
MGKKAIASFADGAIALFIGNKFVVLSAQYSQSKIGEASYLWLLVGDWSLLQQHIS